MSSQSEPLLLMLSFSDNEIDTASGPFPNLNVMFGDRSTLGQFVNFSKLLGRAPDSTMTLLIY
jgi:hypothetical protein